MDLARREFLKNSIAALATIETVGASSIISENPNDFHDSLIAKGQEVLKSYLYESNTEEVHVKIEKELKQFAKSYRESGKLKRFVPICSGKDHELSLYCGYKLPEDTEYKVIHFKIG